MKRIFDLAIATVSVLILLPLFIIISIIIFVEDLKNPFFLQSRGGKQGKHFKIIKFRTMKPNSEAMGAGYKVTKNDNRITKVGSFLRKTSLDEIPQLFNVIKGDMSIVGPRPALIVQTDNYDSYQKRRLDVKPGITGLAQVKGRNNISWEEKIEWDLKYIEKHTLFLDLKIIFLTFLKILDFNNIYSGDN